MKKLLPFVLLVITLQLQAQCWQSISAGGNTAHGIKSDGTLWDWGLNNAGQVGDGTTVNKTAPTLYFTAI